MPELVDAAGGEPEFVGVTVADKELVCVTVAVDDGVAPLVRLAVNELVDEGVPDGVLLPVPELVAVDIPATEAAIEAVRVSLRVPEIVPVRDGDTDELPPRVRLAVGEPVDEGVPDGVLLPVPVPELVAVAGGVAETVCVVVDVAGGEPEFVGVAVAAAEQVPVPLSQGALLCMMLLVMPGPSELVTLGVPTGGLDRLPAAVPVTDGSMLPVGVTEAPPSEAVAVPLGATPGDALDEAGAISELTGGNTGEMKKVPAGAVAITVTSPTEGVTRNSLVLVHV